MGRQIVFFCSLTNEFPVLFYIKVCSHFGLIGADVVLVLGRVPMLVVGNRTKQGPFDL